MKRHCILNSAIILVFTTLNVQAEPHRYYCDRGSVEFEHSVSIGAVTGIGAHRQGYLTIEASPDGRHVQQSLLDLTMRKGHFVDCISFVAPLSTLTDKSTVAMRVNFAFDSAVISPMARRSLVRLSSEFSELEQNMVVEGHTDSIGTNEYNQGLGFRRAEQTALLLKQEGIQGNKLTIKSYGETKPIASNADHRGRALNRRADVVLE